MCVPNSPLFQHCQVYDWPSFFSTKSIWMAQFFWIPYVKGPIFLTSWYMHIFFAQRFFEAAYPLGITWIDCDICVTTSKNGYKKNQRAVYEWVNILDDQVYECVCFFKDQVYEWGRFWNTGSHTRTKITSKLPTPSLKVATRRGVKLFQKF